MSVLSSPANSKLKISSNFFERGKRVPFENPIASLSFGLKQCDSCRWMIDKVGTESFDQNSYCANLFNAFCCQRADRVWRVPSNQHDHFLVKKDAADPSESRIDCLNPSLPTTTLLLKSSSALALRPQPA